MITRGIVLTVIAVIFCRRASGFCVTLGGKDSTAWLRGPLWPNGPFAFKVIRMVLAALRGKANPPHGFVSIRASLW